MWPKVISEIAALLRKWGAAFFSFVGGFFAGRASVKRKVERAERKALKSELEAEREEDRLLSDPDELARMRERYKRSERE